MAMISTRPTRWWSFIEPILDHAIFDQRDYLVEGVNLRPRTIARFMKEADGTVRACFLGYPEMDIDKKAVEVELHVRPLMDWLHSTGLENVRRYLGVSRQLSRHLRDDCASVGIPFIDTGDDFNAALEDAERTLVQ